MPDHAALIKNEPRISARFRRKTRVHADSILEQNFKVA